MFNESDFLFPPPTFDVFLASDRIANVAEFFKVHEAVAHITRCEVLRAARAMLANSSSKVAGNAGVESAPFAGKDVNVERADGLAHGLQFGGECGGPSLHFVPLRMTD